MIGTAPLRIPRWVQLVALPLAAFAVWSLAGLLQATLLVFVVSSLIALLLNPAVHRLTRLGLPRGVAVLTVYLAVFLVLISAIAVAGAVVVQQVGNAGRAIEHEFTAKSGTTRTPADDRIDSLQAWLDAHGLGQVEVRPVGQKAIQKIQKDGITGYVKRAIDVGETVATAVVTGIFRMVLILVVSIYLLLAAPRLARFVNRILPPGDDGRELGRDVQRALYAFVRGQFLVSLIIGGSAGIAMETFGIVGIWPAARDYAIFFGLFAMLTEAIPYVGPILGSVPPILLALFDRPITGLWVALAFLAIHQLEGHVVVPRVMGSAIRSHPLAVIFALLAGGELWGIPGALLALPTFAVGKAVYDFLRLRLVFERWPVLAPALAGVGSGLVSDVGEEAVARPPASGPSDPPTTVPDPPRVRSSHDAGAADGTPEEA